MTLFNELEIKNFIMQALESIHFKELTAVQKKVIPSALAGESLIVQSQTGSGKTHSFMIPIINAIDPSLSEVQAVITAPSRELAEQLYNVANQLIEFSDQEINLVRYTGGTDKQRQLDKLSADHQPHIVIGTPGRIYDLMSEHALWVQTTKIFVVDEADMTMDLGFLSTVDEIASRMPKDLQMMAFSATIPQTLEVFLNKYMTAPQRIEIKTESVISEHVDNFVLYTRRRDRKELAYQLLTLGEPYLALVFCNTKTYADEVSDYLKQKGLKVATVHGGVSPRERKRVMRQIRDLEFQYVVATDLAARGIDIPGTSMVINMEIPSELEFFIHRVGRTGRNNIEGVAYSLISPDDDKDIQALEKKNISFKAVDIVNNEIVEVKSKAPRKAKSNQNLVQDPLVKGMINRNKKRKVKPGYKRKLNQQIKQYRQDKNKNKPNK